jgi:hypothetical protein
MVVYQAPNETSSSSNISSSINPTSIQNKILFNTANTSKSFSINEISSGQKLPYLLEFSLSDDFNQTIINLPEAKMYIDIITNDDTQQTILEKRFELRNQKHINYTSDLVDIAGQTSQNIDNETSNFLFDDITVTATPTSNVFLLVSTSEIPILREDLLSSKLSGNHYSSPSGGYLFTIPLSVRPCKSGEIYENSSNTCYQCPFGTFSLEPFRLKCENCPANADCFGMPYELMLK